MYKPIAERQMKLVMGQMATEDNLSNEAIKLYASMVNAYNQDPGQITSGEFRMGLGDLALKKALAELVDSGYVSKDVKRYLPLVVFKSNFWRQLDDIASTHKL